MSVMCRYMAMPLKMRILEGVVMSIASATAPGRRQRASVAKPL